MKKISSHSCSRGGNRLPDFFSVSYFRVSSRNKLCEGFEVIIKDSSETQFVRKQDIVNLVKDTICIQ